MRDRADGDYSVVVVRGRRAGPYELATGPEWNSPAEGAVSANHVTREDALAWAKAHIDKHGKERS